MAAAEPETMQVAVPDGVAVGQNFNVSTPDGQVIAITCPDGVGPGGLVTFQYIPLTATQKDDSGIQAADEDLAVLLAGMELANKNQEELNAAGVVAAVPFTGEFAGNEFQPAMFAYGANIWCPRSDGSESPASVYEVYLTALGPQYNVFLGAGADGENIFKIVGENEIRAYA